MDPNVPPIDHRLWTYREVVAHILERAKNPSSFHYHYYRPLTGKLFARVFQITDWLKKTNPSIHFEWEQGWCNIWSLK